jgi:hypothetical protein
MLPYILAAVGGYLIGQSRKEEQFADGGEVSKIKFQGKEYESKVHNGYVFATEELGEAIQDKPGKEADAIDSKVAYFFDKETFHKKSPKQLFVEYNKHS